MLVYVMHALHALESRGNSRDLRALKFRFFWPVASSSSGMPVLLINPASPFRLSQDPEARIAAWICDIELHSKLSGSRYCCG